MFHATFVAFNQRCLCLLLSLEIGIASNLSFIKVLI
jgi:hypothetical protein